MSDEEIVNRLLPKSNRDDRDSVPVLRARTITSAPVRQAPVSPQPAQPLNQPQEVVNPLPTPTQEPPASPQPQLQILQRKSLRNLVIIALFFVALGGGVTGGYLAMKPKKEAVAGQGKTTDSKSVLGEAINGATSIPVYIPKNLPEGFTYNNDLKAIKDNVYYLTVDGSTKDQHFYITQQRIPINFDFKAFDKKFSDPDTFTTPAGTATTGPVGANLLGSIRTSSNTWVLINTTPDVKQGQLETVIRSLELN